MTNNRIFKKSEIFDTYYAMIDGVKTYLTQAQRGLAPFVDEYKDSLVVKRKIKRTVDSWMLIKPKRLKVTNQEIENKLHELYQKNVKNEMTLNEWYAEFRSFMPHVTTYSSWMGTYSNVTSNISWLFGHSKSVRKGDTSQYGYRFSTLEKFNQIYNK